MPSNVNSPDELAERLRTALESSDLAAFGELLDPNARWGPRDSPAIGCQSRDQVLAWWKRAQDEGMRARVTEVHQVRDRLLVGLKVSGTRAASERGDEADRWQVLTVSGGRVVDIRGFDDRDEAAECAGLSDH
jgi:hypothetical protein